MLEKKGIHATVINPYYITGLETGLASLIREAWLSALQLGPYPEYRTLVHIPDNPLYYLDVNNLDYKTVYDKLTFRLSYFAKERTKSYSRNERSFGCSQS